MTMSTLGKKLIAVGLPVSVADETHAVFSRTLTDAEEALYMSIAFPPDYAELRHREYPPLADLADAIFWQANGDKKPMETWLEQCAMVKAKYPNKTPAR